MPEVTLRLDKEAFKFSASHFTIFSATHRENLHGHDYDLAVELVVDPGEDGLAFDYNLAKQALQALCDDHDETVLLPAQSPHLRVEQQEGQVHCSFAGQAFTLLTRDVKLLPLTNVTIEALALYLTALYAAELEGCPGISLGRLSLGAGPGQTATAEWQPGSTPR